MLHWVKNQVKAMPEFKVSTRSWIPWHCYMQSKR